MLKNIMEIEEFDNPLGFTNIPHSIANNIANHLLITIDLAPATALSSAPYPVRFQSLMELTHKSCLDRSGVTQNKQVARDGTRLNHSGC